MQIIAGELVPATRVPNQGSLTWVCAQFSSSAGFPDSLSGKKSLETVVTVVVFVEVVVDVMMTVFAELEEKTRTIEAETKTAAIDIAATIKARLLFPPPNCPICQFDSRVN